MPDLSVNLNNFIDTKKYSPDENKNRSINLDLKAALADGKLTETEIKELKASINDDVAFEAAIKDIVSSKGLEEYKEHENNPTEIVFSFNAKDDKNIGVTSEVLAEDGETKLKESSLDDLVIEQPQADPQPQTEVKPEETEVKTAEPEQKTDISPQPETVNEDSSLSKDEYDEVNKGIKQSQSSKSSSGRIESNPQRDKKGKITGYVNYVKYPDPIKNAEAKRLQEILGVKVDGFVGPNTLGALTKKYNALLQKGDKEGLAQLNALVDKLGLKDLFKNKVLGNSIEELYTKAKTPADTKENEVTKPDDKKTEETKSKEPTDKLKELNTDLDKAINTKPVNNQMIQDAINKLNGLNLKPEEINKSPVKATLQKAKELLSSEVQKLKNEKGDPKSIENLEKTISDINKIIPEIKPTQVNKTNEDDNSAVNAAAELKNELEKPNKNPAKITDILTNKILNLNNKDRQNIINYFIDEINKYDPSKIESLINGLDSAYSKASNYDKNILKMSLTQFKGRLNELVKNNPSQYKNMMLFINKFTTNKNLMTLNSPDPANFNKDKLVSDIKELFSNQSKSPAQKKQEFIKHVDTFLHLNSKTLADVITEFKKNPMELLGFMPQIEEWKKGADPITLFKLEQVTNTIKTLAVSS